MPLSPREFQVSNLIAGRAPSLLEDLRTFVDIPTGPGAAGADGLLETRSRLTARLDALGASTLLIPGDSRPPWLDEHEHKRPVPETALSRRRKPGLRGILLCGHLDTVHHCDSPFRRLTLSSDGKTATGPGCVDMKGGLVIAVTALEVLEEAGVPVSWSFLLNSDEETGSYHSASAITNAAKAHDFGLALEPAMADGGLVIERAGSGQFMIQATGRAAHVGRDFAGGISAVNALAECILKVSRIPDASKGIIANIGPIEGGVAANVVPDRARAWGNVRFPINQEGTRLESVLLGLATAGPTLPKIDVHTSFNRPAKPQTDGTRFLADLARSAAMDLGQRLPFGKTSGVCDGNNMQAAGLACIDTLGVRGGGLHTPQEWIELPSLVERCQLLAILMMRLGSL